MSFANHVRVFICVVLMGLLCGYVLNAENDVTDNAYIHAVKDGKLNEYREVVIKDAFNIYFGNAYWRYYEAKTGEHVVELSGRASYKGEKGDTILQFVINDAATEIRNAGLKFNGIVQDKNDKWQLIENVYANWHEQSNISRK